TYRGALGAFVGICNQREDDMPLEQEIIDQIDAAVRVATSKEVVSYREFLERLLKLVGWTIGIIAVVSGLAFSMFFGKTILDTEQSLNSIVNARIIDG